MKSVYLLFFLFPSIMTCQINGKVEIKNFSWKRVESLDTLCYQYQIDTLKGKLDGQIKIWNPEKQLIVNGGFNQNQKNGIWKYYDYSGKLVTKRKYFNSYQFKSVKSSTRTFTKDSLIRNVNNLIEYPFVADSCIGSRSDYWKYIPKNLFNEVLFKNDVLFNTIENFLRVNTDVITYKDSYFTKKNTNQETLNALNLYTNNIIGYKIFEVYYYDKCRSICEARIFGICPVAISTNGEKHDLFWIFYRPLRNILAEIPVKLNANLKTIEDIFHFQFYNSILYYQTSVTKDENIFIEKTPEIDEETILNSINREIKRIIQIDYPNIIFENKK